MRVVSGKFGSRPLKAVPGDNTRPTTDKIKESIFNLIGGQLSGGYALDLFGGSGALGIEAVSRGADHAVICEKYRPAIETIEKNIAMTKEENSFTILKGDNLKSLAKHKQKHESLRFDWVFIDPPYKKQQIQDNILWLERNNCLSSEAMIVCESDSDTVLDQDIGQWHLIKEKSYGLTMIRIYQRSE